MASIKTRIADLELSRNMARRREMTDVQLALRVMQILNHPEKPLMYEPLRKFLNRVRVKARAQSGV
ncbi:MAG: hypothetical protein V9G23_06990 [Giesbergeria sp.]